MTETNTKAYSHLPRPSREQMIDAIQEARDDLYNNLPTGEVHAFDLIILINNHIRKLDEITSL